MKRGTLLWLAACLCLQGAGLLHGADIFRFYAPPGSLALNASYESGSLEYLDFTIEHEGAAVASWFVTLSQGQSLSFDPRIMNKGADLLEYQVYGEEPPTTTIIKDTSVGLSADNVVTGSDFGAFAAAMEQKSFQMVVHIPESQFNAAGSYSDTAVLSLYTGTPANPGSHFLVDTATAAFSGRMARIVDISCVREVGILSLDLTSDLTDFKVATVYETSNADLGYTVSVTSANLAADSVGQTGPYFQHESGGDTLSYDLSYSGAAVTGWTSGTAEVTDAAGLTASAGDPREVRISYSGDAGLRSGSYRDTLTFSITAK